MAYFIFLKYLDSPEDFQKNPHVKIPPKSAPTNFQSQDIFKNQIFISKRIFPSISPQSVQRPAGPSGLSAQPRPTSFFFLSQPVAPPSPLGLVLLADPARPHGPADSLLPPPALEQSAQATTAGRPRVAPWSAPTTSTRGKITAASLLLHSPIKRHHSLSSIPGNRRLQSGTLKLLQRQPLKAPGLPASPPPYKRPHCPQ
jgi:hypothetical protein